MGNLFFCWGGGGEHRRSKCITTSCCAKRVELIYFSRPKGSFGHRDSTDCKRSIAVCSKETLPPYPIFSIKKKMIIRKNKEFSCLSTITDTAAWVSLRHSAMGLAQRLGRFTSSRAACNRCCRAAQIFGLDRKNWSTLPFLEQEVIIIKIHWLLG